MATPTLPVELLEMIIEAVVPANDNLAIPASNITTRTLHSCLTASKATYTSSLELLYSKCLFIDSPWRLHCLLKAYHSNSLSLQLKVVASKSMFLSPFSGDTIDEPQVIADLATIFDTLGNHIRRMVVDMPLRSAYPDRRQGRELRVPLRNAFRKLMALEEFVSLRDELYLSTITPWNNDVEQPVWTRWPNLQRLALYNVDISYDLLLNIGRVRSLKTLVLTRPDGMEDFDRLQDSLSPETTIILVNVWAGHWPEQRRWMEIAVDADAPVVKSAAQSPSNGSNACAQAVWVGQYKDAGRDVTPITECQEWIRDEALRGELFQGW